MLPSCKDWHTNLAGQNQKKNKKNKPNPAGMSDPIAVTYILVCENRVQMESVCSVESLSISKGIIDEVLFSMCW